MRAYRIAIIVLVVSVLSLSLSAQSVSPPIVHHKGLKFKSEYSLTNVGLMPLYVSLDVFSFSLNDQKLPLLRPLDAGMHVRLSESSFQMSAKETRTILYDITCDHAPCAPTVIFANFSSKKTQVNTMGQLGVVLHLPHQIYLDN